MLRPEQISNAKFTPVSAGTYKTEEVDAFLSIVSEAYGELVNERADLVKKISILAEKVESYRRDEESIKSAILDAHKMADSVTRAANEKAETLVAEAEEMAKAAKEEADKYSEELSSAARMQAGEIVNNARNAVNSLQERAQAETDAKLAQANEKAAAIIAEADKKADAIVGNSKKEYEFYTNELNKVKNEMIKFKNLVSDLCDGNISFETVEFISELPVEEEPVEEAPAEAEEAPAEEPAEAEAEELIPEIEIEELPEEGVSAPEVPSFEAPAVQEEAAAEEPAAEEPAAEEPAPAVAAEDDFFADLPTTDDVPDDNLDDFFGMFDEEVSDSAPDLPEAIAAEPAGEQADGEAVDDDFSFAVSDDDADEEDDDITSLFDSLF